MKSRPNHETVLKKADAPKQQALAEDQQENGDVDRVAHIAEQTGNNQMAGGEDRRRGAHTLKREAGEGVQQDRKAQSDEDHARHSKTGKSQERRLQMPPANPPRDENRNSSRSNDEEDCRSNEGERASHLFNQKAFFLRH